MKSSRSIPPACDGCAFYLNGVRVLSQRRVQVLRHGQHVAAFSSSVFPYGTVHGSRELSATQGLLRGIADRGRHHHYLDGLLLFFCRIPCSQIVVPVNNSPWHVEEDSYCFLSHHPLAFMHCFFPWSTARCSTTYLLLYTKCTRMFLSATCLQVFVSQFFSIFIEA
jgi:hypothetical protein